MGVILLILGLPCSVGHLPSSVVKYGLVWVLAEPLESWSGKMIKRLGYIDEQKVHLTIFLWEKKNVLLGV